MTENRQPARKILAWFERKFEFCFPIEHSPILCIRLRGTPARMEDLLDGVLPQLRMATPGGKWSVQEHAGHLLDLEPLWMARVKDFLRGGDTLTAADLSNRKTQEANHNAGSLGKVLRDFRAARGALLDVVEKFGAETFAA